MPRSLDEELSEAARSAAAAESASPFVSPAALEDERQVLLQRLQRLREAIDLLEAPGRIKPDAAARLERYRATERDVTRRLDGVKRQITELEGSSRATWRA